MEFDSVHERVPVYRSSVRGALAQRLPVGLAGASDVVGADRRERDKLDGIDLDLAETDPVTAADLDPWLLPQPDRQRDVAGQHVVAQLAAEIHMPKVPHLLRAELLSVAGSPRW